MVFLVLFIFPVYAFDAPQPGITPDNAILWKLDVLTERFLTAITLDQEEKTRKSIQSAEERLTEMTKMLRKDKLWAAEKAAQQQREALEDARTYIAYLDHTKTETLFEHVFAIEKHIQEYENLVGDEQQQLTDFSLDAEEEAFVNRTLIALQEQQQELTNELQKKKEATILKLRANGLSIEEIIALETSILQKIQGTENSSLSSQITSVATEGEELIDTLFENQTRSQDILNETGALLQDVVSEIQDYIETETEKSIFVETQKDAVVIADTSVKSKIRIEGELSVIQQALVDGLYDSLKKENTKAEIEIEVVEMQDGIWRIEKEVDGLLSKKQQQVLENLLLSFSKEPVPLRIKIKHDIE